MKTLRVVLLVLLSLLLPLRGAVAAAMLCPAGSHGAAVAADGAAHAGTQGAHCGAHDTAHRAAAHHDGHAGGCNACASVCSMTPVPAPLPALQAAAVVSMLRFPALQVPAPSFQSDGQERPPRRA